MKYYHYSMSGLIVALTTVVLAGCQSHQAINTNSANTADIRANQHIEQTMVMNEHTQFLDKNPMSIQKQLVTHHWQLIKAVDKHQQPIQALSNVIKQHTATVNFTKTGVSASVGCNLVQASYHLNNHQLIISDEMSSTMMLCVELAAAEHALFDELKGVSELTWQEKPSAPQLIQKTHLGHELVWEGKPTAESLYGQDFDTVYFSIKHNDQHACRQDATQPCLWVYPVQYQDGIKVQTEKAVKLHTPIVGLKWSPNENLDVIIRVKRFVVAQPHIKGKGYAYVFDGVIELSIPE